MTNLRLRIVEFADAPLLLQWENNPEVWKFSERESAYCFQEILDLIESSNDFHKNQQLRFMICLEEMSIGTIDFFNFNEVNKSIELGILISSEVHRRKGYASQALQLAFSEISLFEIETVLAKVQVSNSASFSLFEKNGFKMIFPSEKECKFDHSNYSYIFSKCVK